MSGDDQKREDQAETPTADIPEVEAELVEEEAAENAAPFDDPPPGEGARTVRRSFVSPGVLFFVGLVVIALAAGVYWYFGADKKTAPGASESVVQQDDDSLPADILSAEARDEKIANTDAAGAKAPLADPSPDGSTLSEATADVDTPTDVIANTGLSEEAKDAVADSGALPAAIEDDAPEISLELEETAPAEEGAPPAPVRSDDAEQPVTEETSGDTALTDELAPDDAPLDAVDPIAADSAAPQPDAPAENAETAGDGAVASLEATLSRERARIAALTTELDTVRFDLAAASDALEGARSELATANDTIRSLRAENDELKRARRKAPLADAAIALNAIEKAAGAGAPFEAELAALKEIAPDADAIAVLNGYALGGAPTLEDIRADFSAAAREGLAAANRENAEGVVERYGARIAALFNIRPAVPRPGTNPAAIISRAEHAAEKGDLPRAIAELDALPPDARRAMKSWTDRARRRVEIDAALHLLSAEISEKAAQPESL